MGLALGYGLGLRNQQAFLGKSWADKMWSSYIQLNPGTYSDAVAAEFKHRMQPDYVENLIQNGGGLNATSWLGTVFPDNWTFPAGYDVTFSRVTGNGFPGEVCRLVEANSNDRIAIYTSNSVMTSGVTYTMSGYYRSQASLVVRGLNGQIITTLSANTGNAAPFSITFTATATTQLYFLSTALASSWIELGNLTMTTTTSNNYYSIYGENGLNKTAADWIYLLTTSGNVTTRTITKTGNALKWNLDGVVVGQNSLPSYTIGSNAGIVTMTSTDGWSGVTALALNTNSFTGVHPNFNTPNITSLNTSANLFTGRAGSSYATNKMSTENISGNYWTTAMVDAELAYYNSVFASTPPIKNFTINLSGATMGIPTGAGNNPDYLGIIAKVQAAGFIPTISIRTS